MTTFSSVTAFRFITGKKIFVRRKTIQTSLFKGKNTRNVWEKPKKTHLCTLKILKYAKRWNFTKIARGFFNIKRKYFVHGTVHT